MSHFRLRELQAVAVIIASLGMLTAPSLRAQTPAAGTQVAVRDRALQLSRISPAAAGSGSAAAVPAGSSRPERIPIQPRLHRRRFWLITAAAAAVAAVVTGIVVYRRRPRFCDGCLASAP